MLFPYTEDVEVRSSDPGNHDGASDPQQSTGGVQYDVFLSYCQSVDRELARALHAALERLGKPWYRRRTMRVFRDSSGLAVEEALWPKIRAAIHAAQHFVLLASPEAAASAWVGREVDERKRLGRSILLVLTGGEVRWDLARGDFDWSHTTALPPSLSGVFSEEPMYLDLRWARTVEGLTLDHAEFSDAVAGIAARVLGTDKSELVSEAAREHLRTIRTMWATIVVLVVMLAGLGVASWMALANAAEARRLAEIEAVQSETMERNIRASNDLINALVFDELPELEVIEGTSDLQFRILANLAKMQETLLGEQLDGLLTNHNRVVLQLKLGDLALSRGDFASARAAYETALRLAKKFGTQQIYLNSARDVSLALRRLGDLEDAVGNTSESRRRYEQSAAIDRHLEKRLPGFIEHDEELSRSPEQRRRIDKILGGPRRYAPSQASTPPPGGVATDL